jgi:hypothetical protein
MVVAVLLGELRLAGTVGGVMSGGGLTTLLTVTVMVAAVAELPDVSIAMAVRV